MKYLGSRPMTFGLASEKYSEGWDRVFGKKDKEAQEIPLYSSDGVAFTEEDNLWKECSDRKSVV